MGWRRKENEPVVHYERLKGLSKGERMTERVPKGYVPMLVGSEEDEVERFLVHIRHLNDPSIVALLEMAAQEFGYGQQGILRIPCNAQQFRHMVRCDLKIKLDDSTGCLRVPFLNCKGGRTR